MEKFIETIAWLGLGSLAAAAFGAIGAIGLFAVVKAKR